MTIAAVVLLAGTLAGCGSGGALPAGSWGKLIGCLRSHPLLAVYNAGSAIKLTPMTRAVSVWSQAGYNVAYVGDNALGADDFTSSDAADVDDVAGPIHFGFAPRADPSQRLAVTSCVEASYPAGAGQSTASRRTTASPAATTQGAPTGPVTGSSCGTFGHPPDDTVVVQRTPGVPCTTAVAVMSLLYSGKGVFHRGTDYITSYTTVNGWRCQGPQEESAYCEQGAKTIGSTFSVPGPSGTTTTSAASTDMGTSAPAPATSDPNTPASETESCGGSIAVNAHTSCPFATTVIEAYANATVNQGGQSSQQVDLSDVKSTVTGASYALTCSPVDSYGNVTCTTSDGAASMTFNVQAG